MLRSVRKYRCPNNSFLFDLNIPFLYEKSIYSVFIALIADKLSLQLKSSEVVNFYNKNKAEEMYATIGIQPAEVSYILSLARRT